MTKRFKAELGHNKTCILWLLGKRVKVIRIFFCPLAWFVNFLNLHHQYYISSWVWCHLVQSSSGWLLDKCPFMISWSKNCFTWIDVWFLSAAAKLAQKIGKLSENKGKYFKVVLNNLYLPKHNLQRLALSSSALTCYYIACPVKGPHPHPNPSTYTKSVIQLLHSFSFFTAGIVAALSPRSFSCHAN